MPGNDHWFEQPGDELPNDEYPDDEYSDDEYPDEDDFDDDLSDTTPCPQCGAEIYEDAVRCPACGTYITHDADLWSGRPTWWIILGLLGMLAVILALLWGSFG